MAWTELTFCFINYGPSASCEAVWDIGCVCLPIPNLGIDGGEWSDSRPGHFNPGGKAAIFLWELDCESLIYFGYSGGDRSTLASAGNLTFLRTSIS